MRTKTDLAGRCSLIAKFIIKSNPKCYRKVYEMFSNLRKTLMISLILITVFVTSCSSGGQDTSESNTSGGEVKLILAAYTTPREAYRELIPIFQQQWKEQTGQTVTFEESYQGSGAQSRAVAEGFEADIVALSLEADIIRLEDAGLIIHDWRSKPFGGMVSTSVVALAVREGNPKNGGAMWNILGLYGAAQRGHVAGYTTDDAGARDFLLSVLQNVTVMDKSARDSIVTFEKGIGDVAITYENEVLVGQQAGQTYELVLPSSTIQIDNPIAVVDTYVDKHGTREVAEAFLAFLFTPEAQQIFAKHGLRSPDPEVAKATAEQYPPIEDLFTIDHFGGWKEATPAFFGDTGVFYEVRAEVQGIQVSE
jgi:sulfate transport system substrate-binding protein